MQKPQGALLSLLIVSWLLASGVMLACSGCGTDSDDADHTQADGLNTDP